MRRRYAIALWAGTLAAAAACQKASESSDAKRMPKPPPSASAEASDKLRIEVEIDGAPALALDATKLAATPPDFKDDEHRAWRMVTLLGPAADRENAVIAATGEKDVTILLPRPKTKNDPVPVLMVNRRGEAFASLVSPDQPFPAFHGHGGMLARPGDPLPRVAGVKKIKVSVQASPR